MKKLFAMILALTMILALCACGAAPAPAQADAEPAADETVYTITFGDSQAEDNAVAKATEAWKAYLEEASNGRLKVELYHNGTMGSDRELVEAVQMGQLSAMCTGQAYMSNFVPQLQVIDVPFFIKSTDDFAKLMKDEAFYSTLSGWFDQAGLKLLDEGTIGFRCLTSNTEVRGLSDLKGLKIRVMESPVPMQMWSDLGCNPTPIAFTELYTALQQGLVEAQENPLQLIYGSKLYEQQKYFINTNHQIMAVFVVMNPEFYASLPADLQAVIDSAQGVIYNTVEELTNELDVTMKEDMVNSGVEFIDLDQAELDAMRDATSDNIWKILEESQSDAVTAYKEALERNNIA